MRSKNTVWTVLSIKIDVERWYRSRLDEMPRLDLPVLRADAHRCMKTAGYRGMVQ
jgi:hypothetical protein